MKTKTIISKSIKDAAAEANALYAKQVEATATLKAALTTLDTLPKTKTGKDTKAVKEAKEKAKAVCAEAGHNHSKASRAFDLAYRLGVIETNRINTNAFCVDKVLAKHGFYPDDSLTGKIRETTVSINQYNDGVKKTGEGKEFNGRCKEHGQIHYSNHERVYVQHPLDADGEEPLHLIVRFYPDDYTYKFSYFGYGPKLNTFGLAFYRNYCVYGMSTFDDDILKDLRVSFSSLGDGYGPEAIKQVGALCTLVKIAENLMTDAPFVETRHIFVEHDTELMEAIAKGETLHFVRRTVLKHGFDEVKSRFNVVLTGKDIAELALAAEHETLCEVDVEREHEHTCEDDSEETE